MFVFKVAHTFPNFFRALSFHLIEISPYLRRVQAQTFGLEYPEIRTFSFHFISFKHVLNCFRAFISIQELQYDNERMNERECENENENEYESERTKVFDMLNVIL
jgi:SAM-dependent MidA family methyltransferase